MMKRQLMMAVTAALALVGGAQAQQWQPKGTGLSTSGLGPSGLPPKVPGDARVNSVDASLPWAIEGHLFTLTEVVRYRAALVGKVVWIKISSVGVPSATADGYRLQVVDSHSEGLRVHNYASISFPFDGAEKMGLLRTTSRGQLSFFVKVEERGLTAVGRSRNIDSFKNTFAYVW